MNLRTKQQQGFTLVELLIVIVIIAILAAISIVAYNGITDRANNSAAKDTASQVKNKAEVFKQVNDDGLYPATIAAFDTEDEAELGELSRANADSRGAIEQKGNVYNYRTCDDNASAEVVYYNSKAKSSDSDYGGAEKTSRFQLNGGC